MSPQNQKLISNLKKQLLFFKNKSIFNLTIIGIVLTIIILICLSLLMLKKSINQKKQLRSESNIKLKLTTTPTSSYVSPTTNYQNMNNNNYTSLEFFNEKGERILYPKITSVRKAVYSSKNNYVVYLKGITFGESYFEILTQSAHLFNLSTRLDEVIVDWPIIFDDYYQKAGESPTEEIYDIGLSRDEKKIAITSRSFVWVYDINTKKVQKINLIEQINEIKKQIAVTRPELSMDPDLLFYHHYNPKFSPDTSKLLLKQGWWEWGEFIIVDLDTEKIKYLNRGNEIGRVTSPIDWITNTEYLAINWTRDDTKMDEEQLTTIEKVNLISGDVTKIAEIETNLFNEMFIFNNELYFFNKGFFTKLNLISGVIELILDTEDYCSECWIVDSTKMPVIYVKGKNYDNYREQSFISYFINIQQPLLKLQKVSTKIY